MRHKVVFGLFLAMLFTCVSKAQTTYPMDKTPFKCNSVTQQQITMEFYDFNCRGVFYASGAIEVFFNGGTQLATVATPGWTLSSAPITSVSLVQPSPTFCQLPSTRIAGCPNGSTPGTFSFTVSGTGTDGQAHSVTVNGTWFNIEYACGGCRTGGGWYAPTLETAPLTVN